MPREEAWLVLVALRGGSEWLLAGHDLHREDRPGLSGLYRAFTMACICRGAKGSAPTRPLAPHEMSFYSLVTAGVSADLVFARFQAGCSEALQLQMTKKEAGGTTDVEE